MLLYIIFRCSEILVYSFLVILKTNLFFSASVEVQRYSKVRLLAQFCTSIDRLDRIIFKPYHIIVTMYIIMCKTFIKIN